jgi:hypothetical protein
VLSGLRRSTFNVQRSAFGAPDKSIRSSRVT